MNNKTSWCVEEAVGCRGVTRVVRAVPARFLDICILYRLGKKEMCTHAYAFSHFVYFFLQSQSCACA